MKVAVLGLWHLGSVTAACAAAAGHDVTGWDPGLDTVAVLSDARAPVAEPGLDALLRTGLDAGCLRFTSDIAAAVGDVDVAWVCFDTPVDDEDRADVEFVLAQVRTAFRHLPGGAVVLSSSQMPVGSLRRLEVDFAAGALGRTVGFACAPENLRLGHAVHVFQHPDRIILGVRTERDREVIARLFLPITDRLEWMTVESAEMTKHAINAFLAMSVTFANEIASISEAVGADAKQVERGLKTEHRIGPGAYVGPGTAFAGGTLARDIMFLTSLGLERHVATPLLSGVRESNNHHRGWPLRALLAGLGSLAGRRVGVWGLTYKPGTDTLRRSSSVELCQAVAAAGGTVVAFDPAVQTLPPDLTSFITLAPSALAAADEADALVIATPWPVFREVTADAVLARLRQKVVLDPSRFVAAAFAGRTDVRYFAVGAPRA